MNLIYDRTAEDVERALALAKKAEAGTLTDAEKTEWLAGMKGCYNASDMNRVEAAVQTLAAELNAAGYAVKVTPVLKGGSRLPSGYTEVEYIESSGTQYVDTGVVPNGKSRIVMDCAPTSTASTYCFYCSRSVASATASDSNTMFFISNSYRRDYYGVSSNTSGCYEANKRFTVDNNQGALIIGDTYAITNTVSTAVSKMPWILLASAISSGNGIDASSLGNYASLKLYSCEIYDGGTLVRDFIPCKNPAGTAGLYDLVGGEFYTTPLAEEPVALPSGYTQIAYLQSTGSQYIDSGVKGDSDVRVTADFEITAFGSGTTFIFGAQGTDSVRYTLGMTSAGAFRSDFGTAMTSGSAASLNTRYSADKNGNVCTVGGQTLTSAAATFTGTTNIYLFGRSYSSVSCSKIKMYRCKMYKAGTLIRDFAPCKNPDGAAGLYDIVNGTFYTNQGSGTFTAGADIVGFTAGAEVGKAEDREWQEGDVLYRSQWTTYLDNVQRLRDAYYTLSETGELPKPEDKLDYQGANTIEKVLEDIDLLLDGMKSIYRRAGTFSAGGSYTRQIIRSI